MAVFVDSCVLLDIFTEDPTWFEWSAAALEKAADEGAKRTAKVEATGRGKTTE